VCPLHTHDLKAPPAPPSRAEKARAAAEADLRRSSAASATAYSGGEPDDELDTYFYRNRSARPVDDTDNADQSSTSSLPSSSSSKRKSSGFSVRGGSHSGGRAPLNRDAAGDLQVSSDCAVALFAPKAPAEAGKGETDTAGSSSGGKEYTIIEVPLPPPSPSSPPPQYLIDVVFPGLGWAALTVNLPVRKTQKTKRKQTDNKGSPYGWSGASAEAEVEEEAEAVVVPSTHIRLRVWTAAGVASHLRPPLLPTLPPDWKPEV
jgi:hypothetical protein